MPYVAFSVPIVGTLYRYSTNKITGSTKSSQFYLGLAMAFGGHVIGILMTKFLMNGAGIDEHLYYIIALAGGIHAGILFFVGFFLLMQRRFGNSRIKVNTSATDDRLYVALFATSATGCMATALNATGILGDFNYRETIYPRFRSLLMLQPDTSLMENVPIIFKCRLLCALTLTTIFPFTRLVHMCSALFEYFLGAT